MLTSKLALTASTASPYRRVAALDRGVDRICLGRDDVAKVGHSLGRDQGIVNTQVWLFARWRENWGAYWAVRCCLFPALFMS